MKEADSIQVAVDEIAADLKANGATRIGARAAYESLIELSSKLAGMGYKITVPPDFNADLTQAQVPGHKTGAGRYRN